jgi:penicillin V acylase-like amidase (Ntn superfamily)
MIETRKACAAAFAVLAIAGQASSAAQACTRVLWNTNKLAVVVGRTMDFPVTTEPIITVLPRGMARDGGLFAGARVDAENPAKWTTKYGSLVTSTYGAGTADGVNEKGVAMHLLFLVVTDFGPRDPKKAGLQAGLWGQFVLDNAATVAEALALLDGVQPIMVEHQGIRSTVRLAIEDAIGDSAIIEYVAGKKTVFHGPEYRILTNDPVRPAARLSYDFQFRWRNPANAHSRQRRPDAPVRARRLLPPDAA